VEFADALTAAAAGSVKLSDSQVRKILERAAELEARRPTEEGALSIGAVEQVAAEVGIAPELVREAARELARPASAEVVQRGESAAGPPEQQVAIDRTIERELLESELEALVDEIQGRLGLVGHVSTVGGTLTWSSAASGEDVRRVIVTVTRGAGLTRIHIEEHLFLADWRQVVCAGSGVAGAAFGALLGLGFEGGDPSAFILVPIALGALWGVFASQHILMRQLREARRPELEELADRLAALEGRP
jgi:hypothetical protein